MRRLYLPLLLLAGAAQPGGDKQPVKPPAAPKSPLTPEQAQKDQENFARKHKIPLDAVKGGAETTYPDYRKKLNQPGVP